MFLTLARINHSCRPNVSHHWDESLQRMLVFAIRDISAGEELRTTYGPCECLPTAARREYLADRFGFWCACEMCEEGEAGDGGDERMEEIRALQAELAATIPGGMTRADRVAALRDVERCLALMGEQGIGGGVFSKRIYHTGYEICMSLDDAEGGRWYLSKELEAIRDSEGVGSSRAEDIERELNGMIDVANSDKLELSPIR